MDPARYARLQEIYEAAASLAADARAGFLETACGGDAELRDHVTALLDADRSAGAPGHPLSDARIETMRGRLDRLIAAPGGAVDGVPAVIGRYRIIRRIGSGGMGAVYEARQDAPRRRVALKLIPPLRATPERLRRFRQEAEVLGRLHHPGIAQIHEAGTFDLGEGAQPFFAMEYVEGVDVRTHAARAELGVRDRLRLVAEIADAVQHAHEQGVIHRDLKPENVFVDEQGRVKVLDFGVARVGEASTAISTVITHEGQILGTLAYMAPEQLSADPGQVTPRADVYALGVMAYELLAGRLPHDLAGLPTTVAIHVLAESAAPWLGRLVPALRGDVETIVGTALEKDLPRRYASAAALAADVRRHLDHLPITARPPSRLYLARKFVRRNRALVAGALATVLTLVAGTVVALVLAHVARGQRDLAEAREIEARRNEAQAVAALLESTHALVESDLPWEARSQHERVPGHARGWIWGLLGRTVPRIISPARVHGDAPWTFLDADRLFRHERSRDRAVVSDLVAQQERALFAGAGFETMTPGTPGGRALARRGTELLLVDLFGEAILDRWPVEAPGSGFSTALSRNGRTIARRTSADTVEIMVDGAVRRVLTEIAPEDWMGFQPDDRHLVIARGEARKLIDVETGRTVFTWPPDDEAPPAIGAAGALPGPIFVPGGPVGRHFVRVDFSDAGPIVRDVELAPRHVSDSDKPWDGRFCAQAFGNDGVAPLLRDTLTGGPYLASRYQDETGAFPHAAGRKPGVQVAPDGSRLVFTGSYSPAWVVDLDPREVEPGFDPRCLTLRGHTSWIYHVALSHDGSLIASAAPMDRLVRVWDAQTGEELAALERACHTPRSWDALLAFSTDDDRLLMTTPHGGHALAIVEWDLVAGTADATPVEAALGAPRHLPLLDAFLGRLAPPAGERLSQRAQMLGREALAVSTHARGTWDAPGEAIRAGGERWRLAPGKDVLEKGPRGLAIDPAGERVAIVIATPLANAGGAFTRTNIGTLVVAGARGGEEIVRMSLDYSPWCAAYSPDGALLAIGTNEGHVIFVETEFHTVQFDLAAHGGAEYVYVHSLAWTPDGTRLVTVSGDHTVKVWDGRPAAVSRRVREDWQALRAQMAARGDLAGDSPALLGAERAAARAELIRRAWPPG